MSGTNVPAGPQQYSLAGQTFTPSGGGDRAQWTFLVYLDGDNNLEGAGIDDFLEMSSVGSSSDVNIVVQFDRIPGYVSGYGDWTTSKRFLVTLGMTPTPDSAVEDIGEANMGDPQTLIDFVQWGTDALPGRALRRRPLGPWQWLAFEA